MTQNEKDLLLKDLCARLPYGVKCQCFDERTIATLTGVKSKSKLYFDKLDWKEFDGIVNIDYCKPYLFPISSMTEEQQIDLTKFVAGGIMHENIVYDWFNKNQFDYRGLIPMGLANDATDKNIY